MAYNRRSRFRARRFRRRPTIVKRAFTRVRRKFVRNTVYRMAETKQVSTTYSGTHNSNLLILEAINAITVGANDNQRIGNKIRPKWYTFNLSFSYAAGTNPTGVVNIRIFIVWPKLDYQPFTSTVTTANYPIYDLPDQDNAYFWYDRRLRLGNSALRNERSVVDIKFYKRFPAELHFSTTTAVAPQRMPFVIIASSGSGLTDTFSYAGYIKVSYTDV